MRDLDINLIGIVISAERKDLDSTENAIRSLGLACDLLHTFGWDARIIPVQGKWCGHTEQSFMIQANPEMIGVHDHAKTLVDLAIKYEQDVMTLLLGDEVQFRKIHPDGEYRIGDVTGFRLVECKDPELTQSWIKIQGEYFTSGRKAALPPEIQVLEDIMRELDGDKPKRLL